MKKLCLLLLASISFAFAKGELYSSEVISLYLNKDDTQVHGRLLPTNAFELVKTEGNRVLLKISGFVNPQAPFVLYHNSTQRVMVAAFSKNSKLNFATKIPANGTKWVYTSIQVWADKQEFVKDTKEMFAKAQNLYQENCGICHTAHKENEFNANQWPATFRSMVNRTGIDKKDHWLIIEYLQKNAKDAPKKGK
ncbi:cytochrome C [Campylobacter sp. MIT 99-7217]|uniref:cytochrome c3 family protein n=1 Tax=Campylobacter sp. MIT 99-7217 TaxID=535091 RepID=UPI001158D4B4|nr:cytochrome c3 family protein [Campylobacter sp. MIT 99-7217]TQR30938.1 cytochrome C [Campylobacter sp. MIT 99-7217]